MSKIKTKNALELQSINGFYYIASILLISVAMISISSCSSESEDGDWEPMKWRIETPTVRTTDGIFDVSENGGTFSFVCRNYSGFWFVGAEVNGKQILPAEMTETDFKLIDSEYFRAEIHGNTLTIEFRANEISQIRNISIGVTAGDIFDTFKFKQFAPSM